MYQNHWFEDFRLARFVSQGCTVTESAIIDFAFRYDPQPFHLDAGAAARSPHGGPIASGFQTIALCPAFIQSGIIIESSIGSPGLDELRWLCAGASGRYAAHRGRGAAQALTPKPECGIVRMRYEAINQRGEKVLSFSLPIICCSSDPHERSSLFSDGSRGIRRRRSRCRWRRD